MFKNWEHSLSQKFKDMEVGRKTVTVGGLIFIYTASDVHHLGDDPVFGDLAFN